MQPVNNKITVICDPTQKDTITIFGNVFKMANLYETNYRLKSPVICLVIEGNELINTGDILLVHHNLMYMPSPYHLYGRTFSIPFSKVLFAKILDDGELLPICGNILGERIPKKYEIPVPTDQQEMYNDRMVISNPGYTEYKKGQTIYTRPSACYDITYHWNGDQKIVTKVSEDMVCGVSK